MSVIRPENPAHLPVEKLTLGCPVLDRLLAGGVPCGSVTELAGEASTGKTQLCLQLLLSAAAPRSSGGLSAASLFISSEPPFPVRRLRILSFSLAGGEDDDLLDHILVGSALSADELLSLLRRADALLSLSQPPSGRPIRLLVLDSVAAIFRTDADDVPRRAALLFRVAAKLKEQARRFNLAVVVTNQVVDVVDGARDTRVGNYLNLWTSGRKVWPALGLAWANCVNMRLFLSRIAEEVPEVARSENFSGAGSWRRRMQVVFAPHLPEASCEFAIRREGVFGVATQA
ncbi:DNA repair protein XRCC3 like [Apostasia shenzhenica]|uniref:DNA repair protein XRCC3 like n=1 Tax=Apostasia shenzhenica TaxID=1088818 RepID=A0A2I0A1Q0_9ASPA|nr:DNA repair protein XRCC3 like [Apostasia shenzhenica]